MGAPYRALLSQIRRTFPQPVSDRIHDSYFVFSLMCAIDQIDTLRSEIQLLGLLSMTECYRMSDYHEPIVALKVYVPSPFVDEGDVELLVSKLLEVRRHAHAQTPPEERRA